jgi:hypothetical protein
MEMVESWDTNANASPLGEKATLCTHPPLGDLNSAHKVLKGNRDPQTVGSGRLSTSLINALNTYA